MCFCIFSVYYIPCLYIELPGHDEQDHHGGVAQTKSQAAVHSQGYHRVYEETSSLYFSLAMEESPRLGNLSTISLPNNVHYHKTALPQSAASFCTVAEQRSTLFPSWMSWGNILPSWHRGWSWLRLTTDRRMKLWQSDKWDLSVGHGPENHPSYRMRLRLEWSRLQ